MHLVVAVTDHGYGHLAQIAPVVAALRARRPSLRITVLSRLPLDLVHDRLPGPVTRIERRTDVGLIMADALAVEREKSAQAYAALHADWQARVAAEADFLRSIGADLVLADVPYLPLAAADRAGLPAIALCSLNWYEIYHHYLGDRPEAPDILREMRQAYSRARCFVLPEPYLPPPAWLRSRAVGPIAIRGKCRRTEIQQRLGLDPAERLVLIALGGIPTHLSAASWARPPGVRWIVCPPTTLDLPGAIPWDSLDLPFTDLLASCDAVLTKPGYNTFVEAACAGAAVLYLQRGDWPEEPHLTRWLHRHARAIEITLDQLVTGELPMILSALWAKPRPERPVPTGAREAATLILDIL